MDTTIATGMGTASAEPFATMPAPATVRIERLLPGPIERVWAYLTESDKRRRWFAAGPMDLQPGGAAALTFRNDDLSVEAGRHDSACSADGVTHQMNGTVVRCEPPRLLVFRWSSDPNPRRSHLSCRRTAATRVSCSHTVALPTAGSCSASPPAGTCTSASSWTSSPMRRRAASGRSMRGWRRSMASAFLNRPTLRR